MIWVAMTFLLQIHAIVLSIFWFGFNFFKLKGMEWISRYKAVFGLFMLLVLLLIVYVCVVGNDDVTTAAFTYKPGNRQKIFDVIIKRTNHSIGRSHVITYNSHFENDVTTTKTTTTLAAVFGWIKKVNLTKTSIKEEETKKESQADISAENMLLPPSKARIHRRIAQLNLDWEPPSESFLVDLPDLPKPKKGKFLVYLCDDKTTCGGLGDRERGIMGSFLLAVATKRRFGLRMKTPCELEKFFSPNQINWTVSAHLLKVPFTDYINAMDDNVFKKGVLKGDFNDQHMEDVIFLRNNMDFAPILFRNPIYKETLPDWVIGKDRALRFRKTWNLLFRPTGTLKEKLDTVKEKIKQLSSESLVCAHVRIGRNPTIPGDQTSFNSIHSVKRLWNFLKGYGTNVSYFIATDSEQVRDMAKREFGSRLISVGGKILHIDRQRDHEDICDGFETALLEQQILSRCSVLVVSQSGFSIYAAYLRGSNKDLFKFDEGQITPWRMV